MDSKGGDRRDDGSKRQGKGKATQSVDSKQKNPDIGNAGVHHQRTEGVSSSLDLHSSAESQLHLSGNITNPSQSSGPAHSELSLPQQEESRGRQRRRERRRMNRESRRREVSSYRSSGSRGRPHYYRYRNDGWRGERDYGRHDRYYYENRGRPSDYRGHHRSSSFMHGQFDYESSSVMRSRSRSPVSRASRRLRSSSRSPSLGRSIYSRGQRSRSRSLSLSESRSRSRSRSRSFEIREVERSRSRSDRGSLGSREERGREMTRSKQSPGRDRGRRRHRGSNKYDDKHRSRRKRSHSSSSGSDSSSSSSSDDENPEKIKVDTAFSKDQRTVFVSQLVMRATEKDIRRYFRRKVGCRVKEVVLLKDKRTGGHKGCAYLEMGSVEDINKAVAVAGQPPDFQRFPILVKASESEKNYSIPASSSVVTSSMMGTSTSAAPCLSQDGKVVESQKVYIGGLDQSVLEEHLFAIFSQFGGLEKVSMQLDPGTKKRKGFAFLSYTDPKVANLAIKTMSNKILAGRPMKTGWASHLSSVQGVDIVTSDNFPESSKNRAQKAFAVLAQVNGTPNSGDLESSADSNYSTSHSSSVEKFIDAKISTAESALTTTVARAKEMMKDVASGATAVDEESKIAADAAVVDASVGSSSTPVAGQPTCHILVHNMFDKDKETDQGWEKDLKEEFLDECSKFGKLLAVTVMWKEDGGKIYATFDTLDAASKCAHNLAGRWFDKRQLRVEYVEEADFPK